MKDSHRTYNALSCLCAHVTHAYRVREQLVVHHGFFRQVPCWHLIMLRHKSWVHQAASQKKDARILIAVHGIHRLPNLLSACT
jgi:hypothetical protein